MAGKGKTNSATEDAIAAAKAKADAAKAKAEGATGGLSVDGPKKKSYSGLISRKGTTTSTPGPTNPDQARVGVRSSTSYVPGVPVLYYEGDAEAAYQGFSTDKAKDVQLALSRIPGLYPKGKEPRVINGIFNSYDIEALGKVMGYADSADVASGVDKGGKPVDSWYMALGQLYSNPSEAAAYFRVSDGKEPKKVYTTPSGMGIADLDETYRTVFGSDASKEEHKQYIKSLNAIEVSQGGKASSQQKEDLIFGLIEKTAKSKTSKVTDASDASMLNAISGGLGAMVKKLRSTYENNGLAFTNTKLISQAVKALRGQEEATNIFSTIQGQAAQFYPAFSKQLESGQSVRDVLDPYISLASQVWEVPEDQVRITDIPMDSEDPTKPPAIPAYKNMLYSDARYLKTQGYKDTQMNDLQSLIREAGLG